MPGWLPRAALAAMLAGVLSYSASLAAPAFRPRQAASPRGLGSNVVSFANQRVDFGDGIDRDLGDIDPTHPVTRYVRARGGVPLYGYASAGLAGASGGSLDLASDGVIHRPSGLSLPLPLRFEASVADGVGTNPNRATDTFRFRFVAPPTLTWATSNLSDGETLRSYIDKLEVAGGTPPYRFDVADLKLDGINVESLAALGLGLNAADGTIFGRPLVAGAVSFNAFCFDANNRLAFSRFNPALTVQPISFQVFDAPASSELVVASLKVGGSTRRGKKDAIQISGLLSLRGTPDVNLDGARVDLRVGQFALGSVMELPVLNAKGSTPQSLSRKSKSKGPQAKIAVSKSKGTFKISVSNLSVGVDGLFKVPPRKGTLALPVMLRIGGVVLGCDLLKAETREARGKFQLAQRLGKNGGNAAGAFILTAVQGADKTGGSAWKAAFIALPAPGKSFDGSTQASAFVGKNFESTPVNVKTGRGKVSASGPAGGIRKLSLSARDGKGSVTFDTLASAATDIPRARDARGQFNRFALRLALSGTGGTVFSGESSQLIFSSSQWKNPK